MLNKPKINPRYHVNSVESVGIFLLSERESLFLQEYPYKVLISKMDGSRTSDEIIEEIMPQLGSAESSPQELMTVGITTFTAIGQMAQQGYLMENTQEIPSSLAIFASHLNIDPNVAYQNLQKTTVSVKSISSISAGDFITQLESLGIQIVDSGDLEIVLTDDYLHEDLAIINQKALENQRPWMLVKPVGTIIWLGPIFHPETTGCWQCLAQRLHHNRPVAAFIQRQHQNNTSTTFSSSSLTPPQETLSSTFQTGLSMAATEVLKYVIMGENPQLKGTLLTHDTLMLQNQTHPLIKRPQCPSCGNPNLQTSISKPLILSSCQKKFITDGGHRSCLPQETLSKYNQHISQITGVIRELTKVSNPIEQINHTYVAKHHYLSHLDNLDSLRQNITGRSAGKGQTDSQAAASAFGEAIERYSGVFQGDEPRQISTYQKLGDRAIHPNKCMNFSDTQYQNRLEWNAKCPSNMQKVPHPFEEDREIEWTPVWSLTEQDFKYLPTAYCYHGYPNLPDPQCWSDTNGSAAGNTREEAILQGFMELVERDSVAIWWYNCLGKPLVDLDSFDEPYFQEIQTYYKNLNREIWVLDITSDLKIPTFAAITRRIHGQVEDIVLGYGTHLDSKLAIKRALTEVNQILPGVLNTNRDGTTQYLCHDLLAIEWWKSATIENHSYLVPDHSQGVKKQSDYPRVWSDDLLDDVKLCQQLVELSGMEMLVLDQTRPDIGLSVVKVIIPGMRHFWKRLAPGRLYEVPVTMGWLQEAIPENQLNPFPMWM